MTDEEDMTVSTKDKLRGFLQWYTDLYGRDWYVDSSESLPSILTGDSMKAAAAAEQALQQFHQEIKDCPRCSLCKTRTNFVFGVGSARADIMFIGEAPGRDEDLQGIPFVGRAGQLLNKMLQQVNLQRESVYIANILKCRPPNNRDPLPEEVAECIPYLHRQIEMIQPQVLVALGRVSAQNLLGVNQSLTSMRNKIWQYQNIPLIVTFHPAYILRNMSMFDTGVADLNSVLAHYRSLSEKGA